MLVFRRRPLSLRITLLVSLFSLTVPAVPSREAHSLPFLHTQKERGEAERQGEKKVRNTHHHPTQTKKGEGERNINFGFAAFSTFVPLLRWSEWERTTTKKKRRSRGDFSIVTIFTTQSFPFIYKTTASSFFNVCFSFITSPREEWPKKKEENSAWIKKTRRCTRPTACWGAHREVREKRREPLSTEVNGTVSAKRSEANQQIRSKEK